MQNLKTIKNKNKPMEKDQICGYQRQRERTWGNQLKVVKRYTTFNYDTNQVLGIHVQHDDYT